MVSPSTEPRYVEEAQTRRYSAPSVWSHPEWVQRFPWLIQGTTDRTTDFGLFGRRPIGEVIGAWRDLQRLDGVSSTVHSRQIHGAEVREWSTVGADGFVLVDGFDAHTTADPGVLLTISVADCVPAFLVVEEPRVVSLAHAGWRGTAAGVLQRSLSTLLRLTGAAPDDVWLHLGPAICGNCYEVGPEVHAALRPNNPVPEQPKPIDLRAVLADSAIDSGLAPSRVSISSHCTLCGGGRFHSHRGGDAGRQLGLLGIKA